MARSRAWTPLTSRARAQNVSLAPAEWAALRILADGTRHGAVSAVVGGLVAAAAEMAWWPEWRQVVLAEWARRQP